MKTFAYGWKKKALLYTGCVIWTLFTGFMLYLPVLLNNEPFSHLAWWYQAMAVAMPLAGPLGIAASFLGQRPVAIDDQGIAAIVLGSKWKSIKWRDVKKIERLSFYSPGEYKNVFQFRIYGSRTRIIVNEDLIEIQRFVDEINRYVREYRIAAFMVDYGSAKRKVAQF